MPYVDLTKVSQISNFLGTGLANNEPLRPDRAHMQGGGAPNVQLNSEDDQQQIQHSEWMDELRDDFVHVHNSLTSQILEYLPCILPTEDEICCVPPWLNSPVAGRLVQYAERLRGNAVDA